MAGIPELVLCWHKKGVVQGYLHTTTDNLTDHFNAKGVEANTAHILGWLKEQCVRDRAIYWLFREEEDEEIKLYDLAKVMQHAEAKLAFIRSKAKSDTHKALTQEEQDESDALSVPLAMLCYRIAARFGRGEREGHKGHNHKGQAKAARESRLTRRQLLSKAKELLEGAGSETQGEYSLVYAHACDALAGTYICIHKVPSSDRCPECGVGQEELGIENYPDSSFNGFVYEGKQSPNPNPNPNPRP